MVNCLICSIGTLFRCTFLSLPFSPHLLCLQDQELPCCSNSEGDVSNPFICSAAQKTVIFSSSRPVACISFIFARTSLIYQSNVPPFPGIKKFLEQLECICLIIRASFYYDDRTDNWEFPRWSFFPISEMNMLQAGDYAKKQLCSRILIGKTGGIHIAKPSRGKSFIYVKTFIGLQKSRVEAGLPIIKNFGRCAEALAMRTGCRSPQLIIVYFLSIK